MTREDRTATLDTLAMQSRIPPKVVQERLGFVVVGG